MKLIIITSIIAIAFISCSKSTDVKPAATTSSNTTTAIVKIVSDTVPTISHDDLIHIVAYHVNPQTVSTTVSGNNLSMIFNENVDLLFTAEGYQETSAIHLTENFTDTLLSGFDYTTVAAAGNTTLNWVDDNLNNVTLKTITDTVINNQKMVKINVHRPFTFFKIYNSNQDASNEQNVLVQEVTDSVSYSSYCYYNQKNYSPNTTAARVVYTR